MKLMSKKQELLFGELKQEFQSRGYEFNAHNSAPPSVELKDQSWTVFVTFSGGFVMVPQFGKLVKFEDTTAAEVVRFIK